MAICPNCKGPMEPRNKFCCLKCYREYNGIEKPQKKEEVIEEKIEKEKEVVQGQQILNS